MNRQQRRMQERKERKKNRVPDQKFEMNMDIIQPWSTFVMKTKLPDAILGKMLEITDEMVDNAENEKSWGHNLAGQIEHELYVEHEKLHEAGIYGFFMDIVRHFVVAAKSQQHPGNEQAIQQEKWLTQMLSMWVISQKDGEYNPMHIHTECQLSSVMYLKIPEFLPSRKEGREDDGNIVFVGASHPTTRLARGIYKHKPKVGDFFVFPAHLQHTVYPFRTDGDFERRSVSFNADFIDKTSYEKMQEQQRQMQQSQAPLPPISGAPEKLTINTENV